MPKPSTQKVFSKGMPIEPPSAKASKMRRASATVSSVSATPKPFMPSKGWPGMVSEAMRMPSP
ncbi:hypothetical protein D3C72_1089790 [compost metagenome]